jgi:hypothetical protein
MPATRTAWTAQQALRLSRSPHPTDLLRRGVGRSYIERPESHQKFTFSLAPAQRGGPNTWMVYLP